MVAVLHDMQPCEHVTLEVLHTSAGGLVLYVKHRRQVAVLKMHLAQKEIGLLARSRLVVPKMVGATYEAIVARSLEILIEVLVQALVAFRGLDDDEAQGAATYHAVAQLHPVYLALIMRDVYAMNLVALGIAGVAIEGAPTEARGTDEEIIENPNIDKYKNQSTQPPEPPWQTRVQRTPTESSRFVRMNLFRRIR